MNPKMSNLKYGTIVTMIASIIGVLLYVIMAIFVDLSPTGAGSIGNPAVNHEIAILAGNPTTGSKMVQYDIVSLRDNYKSGSLSLSNAIVDNVVVGFLSSLVKCERINLSGSSIIDRQLSAIMSIDDLQYLDLRDTHISDFGIEIVSKLSSIRRLYACGTKITSMSYRHIGKMVNLEYLDISRTAVGSDGFESLASLGKIRYLIMNHTDIGDRDLSAILKNSSLASIDLSHTRIGDIAFGSLGSGFIRINSLNVSDTITGDDGVKIFFSGNTKVSELNLSNTRITDLSVVALSNNCDSLEVIDVSGTKVTTAGLASLRHAPALIGIKASGITSITNDSLREISGISALQSLDFEGSGMSDANIRAFGSLKNKIIINLSGTEITDASVDELIRNDRIDKIAILNSRISRDGAERLKASKSAVWYSIKQ